MSDSQANLILMAIIVGLGYLLAGKFGAAIAFGSFLICHCLCEIVTHLKGISMQLEDLKKNN